MPDLTKREWFAGMALPAIIAATSAGQHHVLLGNGISLIQGMARDAFALADAMIAESEKEQPRND